MPEPILFDNHLSDKKCREAILHEILTAEGGSDTEASGMLDVFAYFGHGTQTSLPSAGFGETNISELASTISTKANNGITVLLYACSAGALHGFGEKLTRALSAKGAMVYSHAKEGHTFSNPFVRRFPGGHYVVGPQDKLWDRWVAALEDAGQKPEKNNRLWAEFPFMSDGQLHVALHAIPELFGRWEVKDSAGDTYEYLFFPDHSVYFTDGQGKPPTYVGGSWFFSEDGLKLVWGSIVEVWDGFLKTHRQAGRGQDGSYTLTARLKDKHRLNMDDKKKLALPDV
jgi:hypothetical protein